MAQKARSLTPEASAHQRFGAELRQWRSKRGLSQDALGRLIHASGDLVAKIEKAQRWPALDFTRRCDTTLATGNALLRLFPLIESERRRRGGRGRLPDADRSGLSTLFASTLQPAPDATPAAGRTDRHRLRMPAGRLFAATSIDAWLTPTASRGPAHLTAVTPRSRDDLRSVDLLVTQDPAECHDRPRFYATVARRGRLKCDQEIAIPLAYLLDDFTIGILWAARALDGALLDDDSSLAHLLDQIPLTERAGDVGTAATEDLNEVSQGWLGSYACARFIGSKMDASSGPPLFWTREQRGEEAAMWLMFDHKVKYLHALRDRFADRLQPMGRVFCLPEATAVTDSRAERVLLLLAAALMESTGVPVHVCAESDYAAVEGFVLTPGGTVIVANWLRADRMWHADVIDGRPMVGTFRDALGFGRAHSVIAADTSIGRLRRLADYLGVDWAWLTTRAAQISAAGVGGLIHPRSRLLSVTGIETACRFLGVRAGATAHPALPPT